MKCTLKRFFILYIIQSNTRVCVIIMNDIINNKYARKFKAKEACFVSEYKSSRQQRETVRGRGCDDEGGKCAVHEKQRTDEEIAGDFPAGRSIFFLITAFPSVRSGNDLCLIRSPFLLPARILKYCYLVRTSLRLLPVLNPAGITNLMKFQHTILTRAYRSENCVFIRAR